jgi:hypothetical protein
VSVPLRITLIGLLLSALAVGATAWSGEIDLAIRAEGASPAGSEIHGTVRDTAGVPLAGATVQLRRDGRTLAGTGTGPGGEFRLVLRRAEDQLESGELTLLVHRLGYRPAERMVRPGDGPLEIELVPAPLPLPGMMVDGGPARCDDDDPEGLGRAVWTAAASRHPGGLDTLGVASYMLATTDTLHGVEQPTEGEPREMTPGQRGSAPILRIGWSRRVEREGYAFPVRRTDRRGSYSSWSYAPLEADFAPHFGSEQFGALHHLQLLSEHVDGWTIRFCARDSRHPHLEGTMEVGADTLIRRVEWRFRTPDPDEEAAGWARFPPGSPDQGPPPLLPAESLTRQSLQDDRTVRRALWFEGWILAPGDSVPFLPRRADDGAF